MTPHERAPQRTRCAECNRASEAGDKREDCCAPHHVRITPARSPWSRVTSTEQAALDTGFRRYDAVSVEGDKSGRGLTSIRLRAEDGGNSRESRGSGPSGGRGVSE